MRASLTFPRSRRLGVIAAALVVALLAGFASVRLADAAPNTASLWFRTLPTSERLQSLADAEVRGNVYVHAVHSTPIAAAALYIDDPSMQRLPVALEWWNPVTVGAIRTYAGPTAYNTRLVADGSHQLSVRFLHWDGSTSVAHTRFTVANRAGTLPSTTTVPGTTSAPTTTRVTTTTAAPTTTRPPTTTTRVTTTTAVPTTTAPSPTVPPAPSGGGGRVVAYYAYWSSWSGLTPAQIPAQKLTDIVYAFANVRNGRCVSEQPGHDAQVASELVALRTRHPHLRLSLAVGGASWSGGFASAASAANRRAFVQSCLDLASSLGFDGIDIDWEYPAANERTVWAELLEEFRTQMNTRTSPTQRAWTLTSAIPVGWYLQSDSRFDVARAHRSVDFFNLMAYDMRGSWSATTGHHAALHPAAGDPEAAGASPSMTWLERQGVPRSKIVLGVPFYGYRFTGVPATNNGLFQSKSGAEQIPYRDLVATHLPAAQRFRDDAAVAPWAYNASTRAFYTYDDPAAIRTKANYALNGSYGGVMMWELSQDASGWPLLSAMAAPFGR